MHMMLEILIGIQRVEVCATESRFDLDTKTSGRNYQQFSIQFNCNIVGLSSLMYRSAKEV